VVVPAGVVVHDELLLAETFMVRTSSVTRVELSATSGEALNLSGDVAGVRRQMMLVIQLREAEKLAIENYRKWFSTIENIVSKQERNFDEDIAKPFLKMRVTKYNEKGNRRNKSRRKIYFVFE
jgi:hypothetical protein